MNVLGDITQKAVCSRGDHNWLYYTHEELSATACMDCGYTRDPTHDEQIADPTLCGHVQRFKKFMGAC